MTRAEGPPVHRSPNGPSRPAIQPPGISGQSETRVSPIGGNPWEHYEQWLRKQYPKLGDDEIKKIVEEHKEDELFYKLLQELDEANTWLKREYPDSKRLYE